MNAYWSLVHRGRETFGISFPDVSGCVSAGDSLEDALTQGREALSAHLAFMKADGDAIPAPRSHCELLADPEVAEHADGATWHLIATRAVSAPRVRVNVMIDPGLLREADEAAQSEGITRSALIELAVTDRLALPSSATRPRS